METGCRNIGKMCSCRYSLSLLAFIGFSVVYLLRVNLSIALVAMVKDKGEVQSTSDQCFTDSSATPQPATQIPSSEQFDWDRSMQGSVLGSFFYGYIITQLPGGWMASKYGGKKLFGFGVVCTALCTLLSPLAAQQSVYLLIALRVVEGIGEGVTFPAMHAMWSEWAPPLERSKLVMFAQTGSEFGTIVGLPLCGLIIDKLGWHFVFYISGAIGCLWFIAWMLLTADTPGKHKWISEREKTYIIYEISKTKTSSHDITLRNTPWMSIVTSKAFWGLCAVHFCDNWGYYTLLTSLPLYMKDVLHFDIAQSSVLTALPYIFLGVSKSVSSFVVDKLRQKKVVSTTTARKVMIGVGLTIPAVCLVMVGFVGCSYYLAVALLCLAGTFDGVGESGFNVNHLDIAPKYAGTLMGMTNTLASVPGVLAPQLVGWLTDTNSTSRQWRSVFFVSAEIYVFGAIMFVLLGSGEIQPWALPVQRFTITVVSNVLHALLMNSYRILKRTRVAPSDSIYYLLIMCAMTTGLRVALSIWLTNDKRIFNYYVTDTTTSGMKI